MVVPVIMQIKNPVNLAVARHVQVVRGLGPVRHRLPRVLFHLDVVKLPVGTERKRSGLDEVSKRRQEEEKWRERKCRN